MAIYKRSKTWYIDFQINGCRVHQSAKTQVKQEAQELHDKLKNDLWKQSKLGEKPRYTWRETVVRLMRESTRKSKDAEDRLALIWLDKILGKLYLDQIDRQVIDRIIQVKSAEGVKNATANRLAQFVRTILRKARDEWEWIDSVPVFRLLKEPKERVRYLEREEADRLIADLPSHVSVMARFALATGLRMSNVTGLTWKSVDLKRRCAWVKASDAKAGVAIAVPLSNDAMVVLRELAGKHSEYVFSYRGNRIRNAGDKAWRASLKRCEIDDFHWHDLRHTWASWHIQAGTPLAVLKELGGWADIGMVQKYAHFGSEHLAEYANNISTLGVHVTKSPQLQNTGK